MNALHPSEEQLNDWIDGLLSPDDRAQLERHIAACAPCADDAHRLRALLAMAAQLPESIDPPAGTWEAVAARTFQAGRVRRDVLRQLRVPLAAAAIALIATSAALTSALLRNGDSADPATQQAVTTPPAGTLVATESYQLEFERVLAEFQARSDQLDPASKAIVEENLRIIEQALASAQAALEADPANRELPLLIVDTYRKRIDIVERALRLSTPQARREA